MKSTSHPPLVGQASRLSTRIVVSINTGCHGRKASYPTARAQIPACGTTALGTSEILASVKVKLIRYLNWLIALRNSRFLDVIKFSNYVKFSVAKTTLLTTTIQPLVQDSHRKEEKLL